MFAEEELPAGMLEKAGYAKRSQEVCVTLPSSYIVLNLHDKSCACQELSNSMSGGQQARHA